MRSTAEGRRAGHRSASPDARLAWLAAGLAASASLLFALLVPEHIVQSEGDRAFFVSVSVAEMALAVVLVVAPWWSRPRSDGDLRLTRATYLAGIVVAATGIAVFAVTQMSGTSHHATGGEGGLDVAGLAPRVMEVALIAVLARLLALTTGGRQVRRPSTAR